MARSNSTGIPLSLDARKYISGETPQAFTGNRSKKKTNAKLTCRF
jgi:hypothetical protein